MRPKEAESVEISHLPESFLRSEIKLFERVSKNMHYLKTFQIRTLNFSSILNKYSFKQSNRRKHCVNIFLHMSYMQTSIKKI